METFVRISHHLGYEISNFGRIRNKKTNRILKQVPVSGKRNTTKYFCVTLSNPRKTYRVHRLIGIAFINNPKNLPQINHKDENGLNNCVSNLEWCDSLYNITYSQGKKVNQLSLSGKLINTFESISQAGRVTKSHIGHICTVCSGKLKTHNNFKWEYA